MSDEGVTDWHRVKDSIRAFIVAFAFSKHPAQNTLLPVERVSGVCVNDGAVVAVKRPRTPDCTGALSRARPASLREYELGLR